MEAALPFAIEGFDCDNGSEFLNWHLVRYSQQRPKKVGFTRSRPYHKNENGHVEQKNWTHVRQLLGYERQADPETVKEINTLYCELWEPRHDRPLTPYDRMLASDTVSPSKKTDLRAMRKALNPFELNRKLKTALCPLLLRALHSSRPPGSLHFEPAAATLPT